jgi:hypothetical protein
MIRFEESNSLIVSIYGMYGLWPKAALKKFGHDQIFVIFGWLPIFWHANAPLQLNSFFLRMLVKLWARKTLVNTLIKTKHNTKLNTEHRKQTIKGSIFENKNTNSEL